MAVLVAVGVRPVIDILGFDQAGTELVAWVTRAYLLGLVGHSLLEIAVRAFYARQDAVPRLKIYWAGQSPVFFIGRIGLAAWPGRHRPGERHSSLPGIALTLLVLLNRRYPGILQVTQHPGTGAAGLPGRPGWLPPACWGWRSLPLPGVVMGWLAMGGGALAAVPFVWPDNLMRL